MENTAKTNEELQKEITKLKQQLKAQQGKNSQFEQIVQKANDAIILIKRGVIIYANEYLFNITGYKKDDLLGKAFISFVEEKTRKQVQDFYKNRLIGELQENNYESGIILKNKSILPIDVTSSVIDYNSEKAVLAIMRDISEKKAITKNIIKNKEQLKEITETLPTAILISTLKTGTIKFANDATVKLFGIPKEELIGQTSPDFYYNKSDRAAIVNIIKSKGFINNYELEAKKADGTSFWITVSIKLITYEGESSLLSCFLDISALKQTEHFLKNNQQLFQSLLESSSDFIWEVDINGKYTFVSPVVKDMLGYTTEEMIGKTPFDSMPDQEKKRVGEIFGNIVANKEKIQNLENINIHKDGREIILETSGVPFFDDNNNLLGYRGVDRDITKTKMGEVSLKKQNDFLNTVLESLSHPFYIINVNDYSIALGNSASGFNTEKAKKSCYELTHHKESPCDSNEHPCPLEIVKKTKKPAVVEHIHYDKKGDARNIEVHAYPIFDKEENVEQIIEYSLDITDQKKSEIALKNAHKHLETVFDYSLQTSIIGTDIDGTITVFNKGAERMLGYTAEEMVGKQTPAIIHLRSEMEEHGKELSKEFGRKIEGFDVFKTRPTSEEYEEKEWTYIKKDGTQLMVNLIVSAIKDEQNNVTGLVGVAQDITEQKKAETELINNTKLLSVQNEVASKIAEAKTEEEIFNFIFEKISDISTPLMSAFVSFDDGKFTVRNISKLDEKIEKAIKLLGRPIIGLEYSLATELVNKLQTEEFIFVDNITEIINIKFLPDIILDKIVKMMDMGKLYLFPVIYFSQLIGYHGVVLKKGDIIDESNTNLILSIVKQSAIVLQRLNADKEVKQSVQELQNIIEYANAPIFGIDKNGKVNEWNKTAEKITGFTKDEVLGKNLVETYITDDYKESVKKVLDDALKGKETSNYEFPLFTKDNRRVMVLLNSSTRKDIHGNITGVLGVGQDISELDKLRTDLSIERKNLAKRVEERTAELSYSNAELAKAAKMKDEFLASMSHELRTPLNAILGLSEALQEEIYGNLNEKQITKINNIEESGRHLLDLINEILDLAKIEAGKIVLEYNKISIEELTQASLRFIKQTAFKKKIKVTSSVSSTIETFQADEKRMKQILVNLLSNAVKFTPDEGQIGLDVDVDNENQTISFSVWDTGIGIPNVHLDKLFQPFVQIDSKLSREYEGTGLGLALVNNLTNLHNGSITVDSKEGKGSRFTITIPVSEYGKKHADSSMQEAKTDLNDFKLDKLNKVLIIEDSPVAADQLSRYMEEVNVKSRIHTRGKGAIEKVMQTKPDLIILDILLPDISGWDIMEQLKKNDATNKIPVIFCSIVDEREKGIKLGANEFLVKPLTREKLSKTIAKVIDINLLQSDVLIVKEDELENKEVKKLILLAEDNEQNIATIADYLEAKQFKVIVARNGKEALDKAEEIKPDLVLMDIQMPEMDGLEATKELRAKSDPKISEVPIIALTALAMPGDEEKCINAGANKYMKKPVGLKNLVNTINELLKKETK